MKHMGEKGMLSPFTIFTSIITGGFFPLLGTIVAVDVGAVDSINILYASLVVIGGFVAHWILAHTIHDLYHYNIEKRYTFSKRVLKILLIVSAVTLLSIAIYLSIEVGWLVMVFAIIGAVASMYAEGLLHHESQMAIAAFFLVVGGFYVQAGNLFLSYKIFIRLMLISLFAFFSQYGWLLFYRLDDYGWSTEVRNRSIIITKLGLVFLVLYFLSELL